MSTARISLSLIAILAVALVLRAIAVASQGLWFDEGLTIPISRWPVDQMILLPTDPTPPLYYILHKLLVPADATLLGVRAVSIVSGVASVGLMYILARLAFGARAGLVAAALLAVWTTHVDYSQEARSYSLLFALTLVSAIGAMLYLTTERRRQGLLLFAAGAVLAFYTHVTAAAFIAVASLVVIGWGFVRRRPLSELIVAFSLMALLAAPAVWRLVQQQQVGHSFNWLPQADPATVVRELAAVLLPIGLWANPTLVEYERIARPIAMLVAAGLVGLGILRYRDELLRRPASLLILAWLTVPLLIWLVGFVAQPIYTTRTVVFVIPAFILLIAGLVSQTRAPLVWTIGLCVVYLASTLMFGIQQPQHNFRGAAKVLAERVRPGDVILVCPTAAYPALRYHAAGVSGSAVVGQSYRGELIALEGPLGSDPHWDEAYFINELRHEFDKSAPKPAPAPLPLAAGQSVYVIKVLCGGEPLRRMNLVLDQLGAAPETVWHWRDFAGYNDVVIERYLTTVPATWEPRKVR